MNTLTSPLRGLLGAIAGDVIGSVYEFNATKHTQFRLLTPERKFTDDSILTLAVADALLHDRNYLEYVDKYAQAYPGRGYGGYFVH